MLPPPVRQKTRRVHLSIPGVLASVLPTRWAEFHYACFSPYAVELVCFDLRKRRDHTITRPFADDPPPVQDAVDREIRANYEPFRERDGALIQLIFDRTSDIATRERANAIAAELPVGEMVSRKLWVFFPEVLREAIEQRWRELGFKSLSAYVTSLIRYDLMFGGPHLYFSGKDKDPELLAALSMRTLREFYENKRQRILLDYLIERALKRELSDEERQLMAATTPRVSARMHWLRRKNGGGRRACDRSSGAR